MLYVRPPMYGLTAARHVLEVLEPFTVENGGPLRIKHVSFVEGRGNIIGEATGLEERGD